MKPSVVCLKVIEQSSGGSSAAGRAAVCIRKQTCGHLSVIEGDVTSRRCKCAKEGNEHLLWVPPATPLPPSSRLTFFWRSSSSVLQHSEHPLSVTTTVAIHLRNAFCAAQLVHELARRAGQIQNRCEETRRCCPSPFLLFFFLLFL